jgi:hypothetical protein
MEVSVEQPHGQFESEVWEASLLTSSKVLLVLELLCLDTNFVVIVLDGGLLIQVHETNVVLEFLEGLRLEVLPMDERPQVVVPQKLVLVADVRGFVVMLLAHRQEGVLGIDELGDLLLGHV